MDNKTTTLDRIRFAKEEAMDECKTAGSRSLSVVVTKLDEAELWMMKHIQEKNPVRISPPPSVIVMKSQDGDWEGLYIDGALKDEGHSLGEGDRLLYMLKKSEEFGFSLKDVRTAEVNDQDSRILETVGSFPTFYTDLKGAY